MKILVTGATGFVGNYVVKELLKRNIEIIATSTNIEKAKTFDWFNNVIYKEFNLNNYSPTQNLFEYFQTPDSIIHLAWEGLPNYNASYHLEENFPRHLQFLKNLIINGLEDLNIIGTCFEYGLMEGCLSEEFECNPSNIYAKAKNELRLAMQNLQKSFNFEFKWLRLFYMYGKGQNPNSLIPQLEKALQEKKTHFDMSGGEQIRDYMKIEEVAKKIVIVSLQKKTTGIINCCSGIPIKVKDFIKKYLKENKKEIELNLGSYPYSKLEPMNFWGNITKLQNIKRS